MLINNGKEAQMGRFKGNQKHMIKSVFLFKTDRTIVLSRPSIRKRGFGGMNLFSFCSAAQSIESLAASWISHSDGGGAGWIHGWMDGWLHDERGKKVCYVIKITKQSLAEGLSLPVLP